MTKEKEGGKGDAYVKKCTKALIIFLSLKVVIPTLAVHIVFKIKYQGNFGRFRMLAAARPHLPLHNSIFL